MAAEFKILLTQTLHTITFRYQKPSAQAHNNTFLRLGHVAYPVVKYLWTNYLPAMTSGSSASGTFTNKESETTVKGTILQLVE